MRVYIISGCVTRNKIDDISHQVHFVGYAATAAVILYWKPDQTLLFHIENHVWFDKYNFCISIEDKHTPGYLLL